MGCIPNWGHGDCSTRKKRSLKKIVKAVKKVFHGKKDFVSKHSPSTRSHKVAKHSSKAKKVWPKAAQVCEQHCSSVPKEMCHHEQECWQVPHKRCKSVPHQSCHQVPKEKCH